MKKYLLVGLPAILIIIVIILVITHSDKTTAPTSTNTTTTTVAQNNNAAAPHDNIYLTKTSSSLGSYMTDFNGVTLYTYDNDSSGVSNCNTGCIETWPAYTSGAVNQGSFPTDITVITRSDGTKQFAYKGKPLYYYSGDKTSGDVNGNGIGGIWHIIKM